MQHPHSPTNLTGINKTKDCYFAVIIISSIMLKASVIQCLILSPPCTEGKRGLEEVFGQCC